MGTHISSFEVWLDKIVNQCKKENINIVSFSGAKTKKIERAFYKAFYVYSTMDENGFQQMTDVLRCSFIFNDFTDLYRCYSIIELLAEQSVGGILRVKDRFHPQHIPFGYRDMLINVVCPGSEIVTEIQLHFEPLSKYKKISHTMYKKARLFERETENLAYKYSTQYLRPKIGSKPYEPSKDDMIDGNDEDKEEEEVPSASTKPFDVLLKEWGLEKYIDTMRDEGWDDVRDWQDLTDDDLKNDIGFSKGHLRKWHRNFKEWTKQKEEKEQKEAIATVQEQIYGNNQLKMQLKAAQDAEDNERRRIMQQEQDKINAMRKEMEREKKAMQRKEREAKAERLRKLKELEE